MTSPTTGTAGGGTFPPPPARPTQPPVSLLRATGIALLLQGGGVGLIYLLHVLLARWMGADEYGAYVYVLTWATALAVPAGLGLSAAAVRLVAEQLAAGAWAELRGFLRRSWQLAALGGLLLAGAVSATMAAVAPRFDAGLVAPAGWGAWLIPLLALLALQGGAARGAGRIALAVAPERVARPALLLAGALVVGGAGRLSAVAMVKTTLVVLAVLVAVQLAGLIRTLPPQARHGEVRYETRSWLRIGLPMMFTSTFLLLQTQSDILLIGLFLDSGEVGLYNAASKTATLVSLSLVAVTTVAAPIFAAAHASGGREALQRAATRAAHLGFWPSLAVAGGLLVFGEPLLHLFGAPFVAARLPLVVLVVGQLVNAAAGPVGYLLAMTGHQDDNARVFAVSALLNLGLNALLIPAFGLLGAASASALTMTVWNLWLHALTVRRLGVRGSVLAGLETRR